MEYLVTASPFERPGEHNIPGVQFLRQTLEPGVEATPEAFLSAVGSQLQGGKVTGPVASQLGKEKGAKIDVVYAAGGKTYNQRYYATIRENAAYVLIITWADPSDLEKLEASAQSVRF